ncbi:hypothetical protein TDB9533_00972 [Thalassocella blandensis]|nr:hypothetical protein TDB9533_00972 [Thalassocella blandensis]
MRLFNSPLVKASLLLSVSTLSLNAFSYNCSGVPQFQAGTGYGNGAIVQNNGNAYQCKVGGWCQIGGAYEPGVGWAQGDAWNSLGSCNGSGSSSSSGGSGGSTSSSGGASGGVVTVYEHCNYGGWSVSFNAGDFDLVNLQQKGVPNDQASSIRVSAGYSVTLFEHHHFTGASVTISGDDSCLNDNVSGSVNFNDQISSMKVTAGGGGGGGGSCPAWSASGYYYPGDKVMFQGSAYVAVHENPGYDPTISTWFWDPTTCGGGSSSSSSGGSSSSSSGGSNGFHISRQQFDQMFPNRHALYTYQGFVDAVNEYPGFAKQGSVEVQKRELAAALANFKHETGSFVYAREIAMGEYCGDWDGNPSTCPCEPGKKYYGRGPIQLSWNGNYCAAGAALGLDLRRNPEIVEQDSKVAWKTAIWFWMTQTGAGSMTPHNAIVNGAGFGETIRSINGALECNGGNPAQVDARVRYFQEISNTLGVSTGGNLRC